MSDVSRISMRGIWSLKRAIKKRLALILIGFFVVCPFGVDGLCEQGGEWSLGPLSSGIDQEQAREVFKARGFSWVRNESVPVDGFTILAPSGDVQARLGFDSKANTLVWVELAQTTAVSAKFVAAARQGKGGDLSSVWTTIDFTEWPADPGVRLGDDLKKVLGTCGIDPMSRSKEVRTLYIEYRKAPAASSQGWLTETDLANWSAFAADKDPAQLLGYLGDGIYLVVKESHSPIPHTLQVKFSEGKVVSIVLSTPFPL